VIDVKSTIKNEFPQLCDWSYRHLFGQIFTLVMRMEGCDESKMFEETSEFVID
jgi:hypothetical protein